MSDGQSNTDLTEGLSSEQKKLLTEALEQVKAQLFIATLKKIRTYLLVATGILGIFGVVTFSGIRSSIVDFVTAKLAADQSLKQQIVRRTEDRVEAATALLEKAKGLSAALEKEAARATVSLSDSLQEIESMVRQIRYDLQTLGTTEGASR